MVPLLRNRHVYFEMSVSAGGRAPPSAASLLVGLSTPDMPLHAPVGQWPGSAGMCTTGQLLVAGRWVEDAVRRCDFGHGSTVGCLLYLDDDSACETWDDVFVDVAVVLTVNGTQVVPVADATGGAGGALCLPVPRDEEVYPTLTLHSPGTVVLGRFAAADVLAETRADTGAPPGTTVYALDGSVVLEEGSDSVCGSGDGGAAEDRPGERDRPVEGASAGSGTPP